MPVSTACPSCGAAVRFPDGFQGAARCPGCKGMIPAPAQDWPGPAVHGSGHAVRLLLWTGLLAWVFWLAVLKPTAAAASSPLGETVPVAFPTLAWSVIGYIMTRAIDKALLAILER